MNNIKYIRSNEDEEFYTSERCYILELLYLPDHPAFSIARARVVPGVTTEWHQLKGTGECFYFLSGKGLIEIGDYPPRGVQTGDLIYVPPDTAQRVFNNGEKDLIFLCYCMPAFKIECYEALE